MHAKLTHERIERHHLGSVFGRHLHGFLGGENIELIRVEDQARVGARLDRLPEVGNVVAGTPFHVDHGGVALGAIADQPIGPEPGEIDADRDTLAHVGIVVINEPLTGMQRADRFGVKQSVAVPETDLREPRALAHQHRKSLRADLGVERTVVAWLDAVEAARLIRNHAGEHVETPGRAFRVGGGCDVVRQRQALDQRHDIDAARLQHRAIGKRDLVQREILDALRDRGAPRQEACAHAISDFTQPQVQARRLNLVDVERVGRNDGAALDERRNHVVRQNASLVCCKSQRHRPFNS